MSEDRSLTSFKKDAFKSLFAPEVKDATVARDTNTGLRPDDQYRTIIIGVGGTGVRTLDHIKGALIKKMHPSWKNYIAFLAVDSSWSELNNARYLNGSTEGVCITQNGVATRMTKYSTYPRAVRRFMLDGPSASEPVVLGNINSDGCSRTRLVGKVKIHDQQPGNDGVDEEIVAKLKTILSNLMDLPPADEAESPVSYEVYVIASGCGGTGSGACLEMPALIRQAMEGKPHHIHGILYMPDTLVGVDPKNAGQIKANGYATLKELNYYQGMSMRIGYEEVWTYSSNAKPELKFASDGEKGFYDIPYLIGSPGLSSATAFKVARETIAEFLLSLLGKAEAGTLDDAPFLTSAFLSNAIAVGPMNDKDLAPGNPNKEADKTAHEFPKCFASIGFAEASAPKDVIRAYTVKKTCVNAGLSPVSDDRRLAIEEEIRNGSARIMPFRGEEQLDNALVGTEDAKKMLEPLRKILGVINNGSFNFIGDLKLAPDAVTWDTIKGGTFDKVNITERINTVVAERTNAESLTKLGAYIDKQYAEYEKNVLEYVKEHGPYAFANLYNGNFVEVNGDKGKGIATMLKNLVKGKKMSGSTSDKVVAVEDAERTRDEARKTINTTRRPLIDFHNTMETQKNAWLDAVNDVAKAKINEKRRGAALGENGLLMERFVRKAAHLTDELKSFGHILKHISSVYTEHGNLMETEGNFAKAADTLTEVNIASVSVDSYKSLKKQADNSVAAVKAREFRDGLVDDFFQNRSAWLMVPGNLIKVNTTGEVQLVSPDKPIPARERFDRYATDKIEQKVDVSIEALLMPEDAKEGADLETVVIQLMKQLQIKSQIRFNGTAHGKYVHKYIKFPSALKHSADMMSAIHAAAAVVGVPETSVYPSDDANTIMFYQQATNLEIYRINGLADWEGEYESRIGEALTLMHGKSPDVTRVVHEDGSVTYEEGQRWVDYPSIVCYDRDPTLSDEDGNYSHEGQIRLKLREEIEEARNLGVLYSEQNAEGKWVIKRVYCDRKGKTEWKKELTIDDLDADPDTELFPMGKALVEPIAKLHDRTVSQITKVVRLEHAGLFSKPAATEEYAWEYAERVLRAHHPMMREIRYTVNEYFRKWNAQVREWNGDKLAERRPAMMVMLMKASILYKKADGSWWWKKTDGTEKRIANYTSAMMSFIQPREKKQINNGLLSYWLFKKVDDQMKGDVLVNECERAKRMIAAWIDSDDMIPLQKGAENAAVVETEREALTAKGARTGEENCTVEFATAMNQIETDGEQLKLIEQFYHRTTLEV